MITSISIENLRGIAEGKLEGLAPLTILTGPNASGKSTVLDALLIGGSPDLVGAVGEAVARHRLASGGARWLVGSGSEKVVISLADSAQKDWKRELQWYPHSTEPEELIKRGGQRPFSSVMFREHSSAGITYAKIEFSSDDQFGGTQKGGEGLQALASVRLVDPGIPEPLHRIYSQVVKAGREHLIEPSLRTLLPQFRELRILTGDGDLPELHVREKNSTVPVPLAGDGIQAFIGLVLETAASPGELLLIEEPEAYQHPKAIWKTAEVLLDAMRRGTQIVLTTHSLELIDALIDQASEDDLERSALFTLGLESGKLKCSRRAGEDLAFARHQAETDLR